MKYVLDASVAVKWVLREQGSAEALSLRLDFLNEKVELIAPNTFPVEVAHALTRAERRGLLPQGEALLGVTEVISPGPALFDSVDLLTQAVELASEKRLGVYDCLYVALAEEQDCELVTADARLFKVFQGLSRIVLLSDL